MKNKCDIYMASLWREGHMVLTARSLLGQPALGSLTVVCNNYTDEQWRWVNIELNHFKVKLFRGGNLKGSNEKLKYVGRGVSPFLGFVDDDLIYNDNYLDYMIYNARHYKAYVSLHGSTLFCRPLKNYYTDRVVHRCLENVVDDVTVDICGTGVSMIERDLLPMVQLENLYDLMSCTSMDDLYFSNFVKSYGINRIVLKHPTGFVFHKIQHPMDNYVFDRHVGLGKNCIEQTNFVNSYFL